MKYSNKTIGLNDLVEGFLFSLQADGRAIRTHEYYRKLLRHLLQYALAQSWPNHIDQIDVRLIRQFLTWIGSRSYEYTAGNGSLRQVKPNPSAAWPYYKALRRMFNWSVEEGLLRESPVKAIHFKVPCAARIQPYSNQFHCEENWN